MNDGAEEVFGYKPDELIGKKRVSIFSPGEIVIQNVLNWLKIANTKGVYEAKTNFIKKDGTLFNAKCKITPNLYMPKWTNLQAQIVNIKIRPPVK